MSKAKTCATTGCTNTVLPRWVICEQHAREAAAAFRRVNRKGIR
jgi:hypothetical protein